MAAGFEVKHGGKRLLLKDTTPVGYMLRFSHFLPNIVCTGLQFMYCMAFSPV